MAGLTKKFKSLEYYIELTFSNEFTYVEGRVDILARFGDSRNLTMNTVITKLFQRPRPNNYFVLNVMKNCELFNLSLLASNSVEQLRNGIGISFPVKANEPDKTEGTVEIHLKADLPLGSYVLISITYEGPNIWGWYSSIAIYDATIERKLFYLYSNLIQSTDPKYIACFDPTLKAKIILTINQPQVDSCVISNMPQVEESILSRGDGSVMKQTKFQQASFAMPISWIGFAIGPYHKITKAQGQLIDSIGVNLFEPKGHSGERKFALGFATKAVGWIRTYLELGHPLKTINLVVVPELKLDRAPWDVRNCLGIGPINYDYLLIDELLSSPERKIEVALCVVLMVVQQWFGNIIEPRSAEDIWIIEGLALHLAIRIVNELRPDYRVDQYVRSDKIKHPSKFIYPKYHFKNPKKQPGYPNYTLVSSLRSRELFCALQMYLVEDQFDQIIRSLVSNGLTKGISRSMLTKAFANPGLSKRKIDKMIELMCSPESIIFVDLEKSSLVLNQSMYSAHFVWPLNIKVFFSSFATVSEVPVKHSNKDKRRIAMEVPDWFDCKEDSTRHWLTVVIGENKLLPHHVIHYSNKLISRLRRPIEMGLLSPLERISIIRHVIRREDFMDILADLVECYSNEQDPDVLLELVWAIDKSPYKYPYQDQLKRIYTQVGGLQVTGQESPSEQCVKSIVALMLVKLHDKQVIKEALALFDSMGDKLVGFQREPVYMAVATKRLDREMFSSRLEEASLPEERARIRRMISYIIIRDRPFS